MWLTALLQPATSEQRCLIASLETLSEQDREERVRCEENHGSWGKSSVSSAEDLALISSQPDWLHPFKYQQLACLQSSLSKIKRSSARLQLIRCPFSLIMTSSSRPHVNHLSRNAKYNQIVHLGEREL